MRESSRGADEHQKHARRNDGRMTDDVSHMVDEDEGITDSISPRTLSHWNRQIGGKKKKTKIPKTPNTPPISITPHSQKETAKKEK